MTNFKLRRLFSFKQFNIIFSVIVAFFIWFFVSLVISPDFTIVVTKVPVNLEENSSVYKNLGLEIIGKEENTVDIEVTGARAVVGNLSKDDFNVTVQYNSVKGPGNFNLPVVAVKDNFLLDFRVVSVDKKDISINFDEVVTKKISIEPDVSGIKIAKGFVLGKVISTPGEVNIKGPKNEVERIEKATTAKITTGELNQFTVQDTDIIIYDTAGNEVQSTNLNLDVEKVEVSIPVLKTTTLKLKVDFINVPQYLSTEIYKYNFSEPTIEVAAPEAALKDLTEFSVGYIDIATLKMNAEYQFELKLPTGFVNLNNIATVTVKFDTKAFSERVVSVSDIRITNANQAISFDILTTEIKSVKLIGLTSSILSILNSQVIAEISANNVTVSAGQQNIAARILIPSQNSIFAVGEYTVLIEIKE